MMTFVALRAGGYEHWKMHQTLKTKMPVAIVVGCPPLVAFQGPQKLAQGVDEIAVAGGLAGGPINVVRGRTVDLMIPAEAEIVIEGYADPDYLEPEGPFGELHGYVALEDYNLAIDVTAITRRRNAIFTSIISQVTPSELSVIKRVAYEPLFLSRLRDQLGIKGLKRVVSARASHQSSQVRIPAVRAGTPRTEIWRALHGALTLQAIVGKFVIAIDDDIDPENADFGVLGDVVSLQSDRGHACGARIANLGTGRAAVDRPSWIRPCSSTRR